MQIEGGEGLPATATIEPAICLYREGIFRSRYVPNASFFRATNGTIEGGDATGKSLMGRATIPVVPVLRDAQVKAEIEKFFNGSMDDKGSLKNLLPVIVDPSGTSPQDIKIQTKTKTPERGFLLQRSGHAMYMSCDNQWLGEAVTGIQTWINWLMNQTKAEPVVAQVGYGLCETNEFGTGLVLKHRPGLKIKFAEDYLVQQFMMTEPFTTTQMRQQVAYVALLAEAIERWIPITGYTFPDYCALANTLLMVFSGTGDIKIERPWTAFDIVERIKTFIGLGISRANPYLPMDMLTYADWLRTVCIVLAFCSIRTKATTHMVEFYRLKGNFNTIGDYWNRYTAPAIEGFGSLSAPYHIMPYNEMGSYFPLPAVININEEKPNLYRWLRKERPIKYETLDVRHGEVTGDPFSPMSTEERHFLPVVHNDVRRIDVQYPIRDVSVWELPMDRRWDGPINPTTDKNYQDEAQRKLLLFLGLLSNGATSLKGGYHCYSPGIIHRPTDVTWYVNRLEEITIVKGPDFGTAKAAAALQELTNGATSSGPSERAPPGAVPLKQTDTQKVEIVRDAATKEEKDAGVTRPQ